MVKRYDYVGGPPPMDPMGERDNGDYVDYDDYAALLAENERLKSVIYGRSSGSNLNELFGDSEELLVAIRGFIGASWMPAKDESTEDMRQTYSYWHKRLIKAVGTMGYFDAEDVANHCAGSDRNVALIEVYKGE